MKLYVVATPIGNLSDITERMKRTLESVDLIAAEDTRHSKTLMQHLGIKTPLVAYHDHNEGDASSQLVAKILGGTQVAIISDAGTPLISDPGYRLVQQAHAHGIEVIPIPGPSALITALSVSGLPTDRFLFIGFLPSKFEARKVALEALSSESSTIVFYESRHRIVESVNAMKQAFGGTRRATIGRELTKRFEQTVHGSLDELCEKLSNTEIAIKGEFVVMVAGSDLPTGSYDHEHLMKTLLSELPPRKAAGIAAELTGESKKYFYDLSLDMKGLKKD